MQFLELATLAQLVTSVSALAVAGSRNNVVKARTTPVVASATAISATAISAREYPTPYPSPSSTGEPQCSGYYTFSPSEWNEYGVTADGPVGTCVADDSSNSKGTCIHVSSGCIAINDSPRCQNSLAGPYNVADDDTPRHISSAYIYSKFDSGNHDSEATPGCELFVTWPGAWGDLDFTDDCLTDRTGVYKQCCSDETIATKSVINPYSVRNGFIPRGNGFVF
ncbi:hypothetical protein PEX2_107070 [Penicillium expansum]|uniref:Uncharacterized protein n=1 Tax=Penicillium expansum TaxID=27334 RepID=A0A0A2J728_PENEN|nr:hypothetical protein PEX2_107070 [Penicillium expansum]KGO51182.1 hypothetical protein PEX2_107070 [Penicillium expansum]